MSYSQGTWLLSRDHPIIVVPKGVVCRMNAFFPQVNMMKECPPVTIIGISDDRKTISISEDKKEWAPHISNRLGFYLDGDLEKLPTGQFISDNSIENKTSTEIVLANPVDKSIELKLGETKARLHRATSNYMYPACCSKNVPFTWTTYEDTIHGEVFEAAHNKFRLGTKQVKIGFLANHNQGGKKVEFIVKKLKFQKVEFSL